MDRARIAVVSLDPLRELQADLVELLWRQIDAHRKSVHVDHGDLGIFVAQEVLYDETARTGTLCKVVDVLLLGRKQLPGVEDQRGVLLQFWDLVLDLEQAAKGLSHAELFLVLEVEVFDARPGLGGLPVDVVHGKAVASLTYDVRDHNQLPGRAAVADRNLVHEAVHAGLRDLEVGRPAHVADHLVGRLLHILDLLHVDAEQLVERSKLGRLGELRQEGNQPVLGFRLARQRCDLGLHVRSYAKGNKQEDDQHSGAGDKHGVLLPHLLCLCSEHDSAAVLLIVYTHVSAHLCPTLSSVRSTKLRSLTWQPSRRLLQRHAPIYSAGRGLCRLLRRKVQGCTDLCAPLVNCQQLSRGYRACDCFSTTELQDIEVMSFRFFGNPPSVPRW
mmetsp:Transcript_11777/g.35916  ORF Transcript_11777/g.35916 Transcript_11777/m.35916 type:complete len:387 (-) Transcript_11777:8-1168(-)